MVLLSIYYHIKVLIFYCCWIASGVSFFYTAAQYHKVSFKEYIKKQRIAVVIFIIFTTATMYIMLW